MISLRRILADTLEDQFVWDATLPRTLQTLVLRPGLLTREYVNGRVARYIPPMRLYLAASLLFFLALSFVASPARVAGDANTAPAVELTMPAPPAPGAPSPTGAPPTPAASSATGAPPTPAAAPQTRQAAASSPRHAYVQIQPFGPAWMRHRLEATQARLSAMEPRAAIGTLVQAFWNTAPKVAFLLLPVFALILKVLYLRRRRLYVEHFVFALHAQALGFLAFTVMLLLRSSTANLLLGLAVAAYVYLAMLRVYGQGWLRTLLKFGMLSCAYTFVLAVGVALGAVFAVLTL